MLCHRFCSVDLPVHLRHMIELV